MNTVVKTACFVVTGEMMTWAARDLMRDDEPGKAYRLLADGLQGDGAMEATLSILKGTHELAGDSSAGLELVESDPSPELERYLADIKYIYAGRYRDGQAWRRPVAYMVQFGSVDGDWASKQLDGEIGSQGSPAAMKFSELRAKYYCGRGEEPVALNLAEGVDEIVSGKVWVITETCGEIPHWWRPPNTAQEALDQLLAARRTFRERKPAVAPSAGARRLLQSDRDVARAAEREAAAERRAAAFDAECIRIAEEVRVRAGADTFQMTLASGRVLDVPRAPFVRWALHRTEQSKLAPDWENVASGGMKLQGDNPDHTDWVLGSGLKLSEAYYGEVNDACIEAMCTFQEQARGVEDGVTFPGIFAALKNLHDAAHQAAVLVDAGERTGVVGEDVVVFPDSAGSRVGELHGATGVIVERGGGPAGTEPALSDKVSSSVIRDISSSACRLKSPFLN